MEKHNSSSEITHVSSLTELGLDKNKPIEDNKQNFNKADHITSQKLQPISFYGMIDRNC